MINLVRRFPTPALLLLLALPLSGCGTYMVAKTVTNTGALVAGTAVGTVKMTGKAAGKAAGAITGVGRDRD